MDTLDRAKSKAEDLSSSMICFHNLELKRLDQSNVPLDLLHKLEIWRKCRDLNLVQPEDAPLEFALGVPLCLNQWAKVWAWHPVLHDGPPLPPSVQEVARKEVTEPLRRLMLILAKAAQTLDYQPEHEAEWVDKEARSLLEQEARQAQMRTLSAGSSPASTALALATTTTDEDVTTGSASMRSRSRRNSNNVAGATAHADGDHDLQNEVNSLKRQVSQLKRKFESERSKKLKQTVVVSRLHGE